MIRDGGHEQQVSEQGAAEEGHPMGVIEEWWELLLHPTFLGSHLDHIDASFSTHVATVRDLHQDDFKQLMDPLNDLSYATYLYLEDSVCGIDITEADVEHKNERANQIDHVKSGCTQSDEDLQSVTSQPAYSKKNEERLVLKFSLKRPPSQSCEQEHTKQIRDK